MVDLKQLEIAPERDRLDPMQTPRSNIVMKGPDESVGDLHSELSIDTYYGEKGVVVSSSAWDLDERQRELVAAGAHIRLSLWQHPIPPMAVSIEAPYCGCSSPTVWVRDAKHFRCPACGDITTVARTAPELELVKTDDNDEANGEGPAAA